MEQWISERGCLLHHGGDPGPRRRPHTTLSGINNVYFTFFTADGKRLLVLNLLVRTAFLGIKAAILNDMLFWLSSENT